MSYAPVIFQFEDADAAKLALDTLRELDYHVHMPDSGQPLIQLAVVREDLTSALEIIQSYGGNLIEEQGADGEYDYFEAAYGLDGIPIPAHIVNDDWAESDMSGSDADSGESIRTDEYA